MHRSTIVAPIIAIALLLAACGGDDDSTTATDDTTEETSEATEEETETTSEDDGTEPEETEVDEEALAESMGECGFLAAFATAFSEFDPTTMYSGEEATDFGQLFAPLAQATKEVADAAPEEIRDAFGTLAEGFDRVAQELEGVVLDLTDPEAMDPETMAKLESLDTAFGDDYEAAAAEVDAWMTENCSELAEEFDLGAFGS